MSIQVFPTAPSPTVTHLTNLEALIFLVTEEYTQTPPKPQNRVWRKSKQKNKDENKKK